MEWNQMDVHKCKNVGNGFLWWGATLAWSKLIVLYQKIWNEKIGNLTMVPKSCTWFCVM
jgi:hypothetical protein